MSQISENLAKNAWLTLLERVSVWVVLAGVSVIGFILKDLNVKISDPNNGLIAVVSKVRTTQEEAIVPGVANLNVQINGIHTKMFSHKWYSRDDAERLDDQHQKIFDLHDGRLRDLEKR